MTIRLRDICLPGLLLAVIFCGKATAGGGLEFTKDTVHADGGEDTSYLVNTGADTLTVDSVFLFADTALLPTFQVVAAAEGPVCRPAFGIRYTPAGTKLDSAVFCVPYCGNCEFSIGPGDSLLWHAFDANGCISCPTGGFSVSPSVADTIYVGLVMVADSASDTVIIRDLLTNIPSSGVQHSGSVLPRGSAPATRSSPQVLHNGRVLKQLSGPQGNRAPAIAHPTLVK